MDQADRELLMHVVPSDTNLKRLYAEHIKLEKEVEHFQKYAAYSSSAALRQRELKKEKLRGMETIMEILKRYRA